MSIEYLNMAFKSEIRPSARKFVLVAMCDYCNEEGEAYPSIETLCRKTSLNRKTVQAHLTAMVEIGLLELTGRKVGKTNQIPVYHIVLKRAPKAVQLKTPKNGSVKQAQKRAIEPSVSFNHQIEANNPLFASGIPPANLNIAAWEKWMQYRKVRRLPKYATDGIAKKLSEIPTNQQIKCVEHSIDLMYQGIFPEKYKNETYQQASTISDPNRTDWEFDSPIDKLCQG